MSLSEMVKAQLLVFQQNEITEHLIYKRLAKTLKSPGNQKILERIAEDELRHYQNWKKYTGVSVKPNRFKVWKYYWISRIFGITFGIKLMENGEEAAQKNYKLIANEIPDAQAIAKEEDEHEAALIGMLDEERLQYIGSVVLGLNDALVELTGALAGFTLALQNTKLIALTGSITGIAAALSMAVSEYLSTKGENTDKHPLKASVYTGIAYLVTVVLLILPYLLLGDYYVCLTVTLFLALLIIGVFNYYLAVAKGFSFKARFFEMAGLSLGIAGFTFLLGFVLRAFFGIDV